MSCRNIIADTAAAEIAEAALVLPLMFFILLGIFWIGRAYNTYATLNHAAREGARVAASPVCATCTAGSTSLADQAANTMSPILQAAGLDPGLSKAPTTNNLCTCGQVACTPPSCSQSTATPQILVCQNVDLGVPNFNPPACGTAVVMQYPFKFPLVPIPLAGGSTGNYSSITLTGEGVARTEQ